MSSCFRGGSSFALIIALIGLPARARDQPPPPHAPDEVSPGDEFVGPFPSWTNAKAALGAIGDGAADDTAAIQRGLTALGGSGRSPILYLPRGTYRITRTLTMANVQNVGIVGEDPATTVLMWDGAAGGTMLSVNGVAYSRVARLTFNGSKRASAAVDQSWDGARPHFDTGNEYADDRFVDAEHGIRGGFKGHGFAETSIVRAHFIRNTVAGVALGNLNALDVWVWDSRFEDCGIGVTNGAGGGNFRVYNSVFRRSTFSDLAMGNTGGFSARGNYSAGSQAFFVSVLSKAYPATIHLQRNTIVDPVDAIAIDLRNQGPALLTDNVIRRLPNASGPVVRWNGVDGADLTSVGNTFSSADPIRTNGRFLAVDDRTLARAAIAPAEPVLPETPRNRARPVVEARGGDIQRAIDAAMLQKGNRPIVHVPFGTHAIAATLTIPASDIQLVGDGYGTVLRWAGAGRGPLLRVEGPTRMTVRELQIDAAGTADGVVVAGIEQTGSRAYLDQVRLRSGTQANLFVDGLERTAIDARDFDHAYAPTGASIKVTGSGRISIFSGASAANATSYDVSGGARVLVRDVWYESAAGSGFASIHGAATFTIDGSRVASPPSGSPPAFDIAGLNGDVAIVATHIDGRIAVSGRGDNARVLGLALFDEKTPPDYFLNRASPPAHALLLNSRHRREAGPGNRSIPTPDGGAPDPPFITRLLAHTRGEMPAPLTELPAGVSDFRMFRVLIGNGINNLTLRP